MAALIALQLRLCWRGFPQMLRVSWILLAVMLVSYLSKRSSGSDLYPMLAAPLVMILLGALLAIGSTDPLIWQVPIRRSARVWARVVLLSLSGALATAFVASLHVVYGSRPPERWPLYLANLELCLLGGGLLLFLAGDLVRRAHVFVQLIVIIVAAS